ncbi:MAG: hypothetical protein HQM12_21925, partial [SAR324 cluster bacterium]|nr:hypothetical protein [SAR324 cluster bacterium]
MTDSALKRQVFLDWKQRIIDSGHEFHEIKVLAEVERDKGQVYATLYDCDLITPEHQRMWRSIVVRGDSVVVVPVLHVPEHHEDYTLMVEQRRIVDGQL